MKSEFLFGHKESKKNFLALYTPTINSIIVVDYRYDLLKKLQQIFLSKIRLCLVNLLVSCNNYNTNLDNTDCIKYGLKFDKESPYGPTIIASNFDNYQCKIEANNISSKSIEDIKKLKEYMLFCGGILEETHQFFYQLNIQFDEKYAQENINFLYKIGVSDDNNINNVLNIDLNKKNYFLDMLERIMFIANSKEEYYDLVEYFVNNDQQLEQDYLIEKIVLMNDIEINKNENFIF